MRVPLRGRWIGLLGPTQTNVFGATINVLCCVGPPMVNTDGTAYLEYEVRNNVNEVVTSDTLYLMQINPDNSSSSTVLSATTQNETQYPGNIIPDGQGGVLATWSVSMVRGTQPTYPYQAVDVSGGAVGTAYNLPFSPQAVDITKQPDLVLGENGVAFAKGQTTVMINGVAATVDAIISFNLGYVPPNLGPGVPPTPSWTYQAPTGTTLTIIAATQGNGVVVKIVNGSQPETVVSLDSTGAPTVNAGASIGNQTDYSWWGDWNLSVNGGVSAVAAQRAQVADDSASPNHRGNPSHTGKAGPRCVPLDSTSSHFC